MSDSSNGAEGSQRGFGRSDLAALYSASSEAAVANRKAFVRLGRLELGLLISTSALVALEGMAWISQHDLVQAIRIAVALVLAVALVVKFVQRLRRYDQAWYDARSAAEGSKSLSWQYMMQTPPFDGPEPEARNALRLALDRLIRLHPTMQRELHRLPADQRQVTQAMRDARSLDFAERKQLYDRHRIDDQLSWYRRNSRSNRKSGETWFIASLVAQLVALFVAITRAGIDRELPIIQLTIAVTIAVTALGRSFRFDDLSREFGVAAEELASLKEALDVAQDEKAFQEVVAEVETVIAKENGVWNSSMRRAA
jgi:hypothetical protein